MKFVYFDAFSGLSGDMILGALLDLGVPPDTFIQKMAEFDLPVHIRVQETKRSSLRALKVDVHVRSKTEKTRKWADVEKLIANSTFTESVKNNALQIFQRLFEAEAHVHGHTFQKTHLHEAGADDAIIDIVGSCFLFEQLNISKFYASPLNVGQGSVKTSHGILSVPPPAVAELLKGIPVYSDFVKQELVTPTGAAIVSSVVEKFLPFPELCYEKVGCGAGGRDFPDFPNILRVFYGERQSTETDRDIYVIETNIDDSTPEILASFYDKAFSLGALDVYLTPVFMKKNRLATKLTLLAELDKMDTLMSAIFEETSSLGVRYFPVSRRVLERKIVKVRLFGEEIPVKVAFSGPKAVNIQPEFSDCLKLAQKKDLPVKHVMELVKQKYLTQNERKKNSRK
ncbi:MAG: nickel pincer cofactor biosynthesis protein LarC [Candidatus Aminicenantes bacterium]|nr:nickel pincer cofactor biosynthesis protein LarC [Candidatus Aminicenantes bacterium]